MPPNSCSSLLSASLITAVLAVYGLPAPAAWNTETIANNVVSTHQVPPKVAVAYKRVLSPGPGGTILSRDLVAVAFEDTSAQVVKLATKLGTGTWEITQFEAGSFAPTLAMDSAGGIHIAYVRPSVPNQSNLVYARKTGIGMGNCAANNSFNCEALAYQGLGGCSYETANPQPSIAIASNGTPRLAVLDCVGQVLFSKSSGLWQQILPGQPQALLEQLHLRIRSDGKYYLFGIQFPETSTVAWDIGPMNGGWYHQPPVLIVGKGAVFSVAIDSQDLPQFCVTAPSPTSSSSFRYVTRGLLDWNISIAYTNYASDCSIAMRSDGKPGISFHEGYTTGLFYAEPGGNLWNKEPVDTVGSVGFSTSLFFDNLDKPIIAYVDWSNFSIKPARRQ